MNNNKKLKQCKKCKFCNAWIKPNAFYLKRKREIVCRKCGFEHEDYTWGPEWTMYQNKE